MKLSSQNDNSRSEPAVTNQALAPVMEFLLRHAPFDRMAPSHLEFLARHLNLGFYANGEIVTEPAHGTVSRFYIIKQGRIRGETDDGEGPSEDGAWELIAGESFPIGALLARRPVRTVHRAMEDTFCFELDREHFDQLIQKSPEFHDFCTRRLASLLDQALQGLQGRVATSVASGEASLNAPLSSLIRRAPVTCRPHAPIRDALQSMNDERVGSIIITDEAARPQGVFTLHDLLGRVITTGIGLDAPIEQVMTRRPLSLPPQAAAHEAAALMARMGFGHVCVVEHERLIGIVSERDLFSLQRVGLVQLSRSITHAPDIATLARLAKDIHRVIDQMLVQGASVAQLMQLITLLNDHITRRVIVLCEKEYGRTETAFTWLAFGSEGRREQALKTDQDNGILFVLPPGRDAESVRRELLPLAKKINQALDTCGYPLCRGNVMASNPECCLSLEEWAARFTRWIEHGTPEHLLKASIFFDFRVLYGDRVPAQELRTTVLERAAANQTFLRQMAQNSLRNRPPLGLVRDFVVASGGEHPHTIDLKLNGLMPFVDGARLFALANRIEDTGTLARLKATSGAGKLRTKESNAWGDAFGFIQLMRMRAHQEQERRGESLDNHVDPDGLNDLERRILKESFRQARKMQSRLALDYQL